MTIDFSIRNPYQAEAKLSICIGARSIKRKENSLYNSLRSIYEDSIFVGEISQLWPELPLLANSDAASGTLPTSTPPVTSNPPMATPITCPSTPLASISMSLNLPKSTSSVHSQGTREVSHSVDWDCYFHLPLWVSETERVKIENQLEEWTEELEASGADIASLEACLKKPLRPLWISQKSIIRLNEVPDHDSWDFTPILVFNWLHSDHHYVRI